MNITSAYSATQTQTKPTDLTSAHNNFIENQAEAFNKQLLDAGLSPFQIKAIAERLVAMHPGAPSTSGSAVSETGTDTGKNLYNRLLLKLLSKGIIDREEDISSGNGGSCCNHFFDESTIYEFAESLTLKEIKCISVTNGISHNRLASLQTQYSNDSDAIATTILTSIRDKGSKCLHQFMYDLKKK